MKYIKFKFINVIILQKKFDFFIELFLRKSYNI